MYSNPSSPFVWYKNLPMGQNTINNIMKRMVENSPLQTVSVDKKLTNHSARKTLVKKLKRNHIAKSEIIGITGHNSEAGLDAYDSGDEDQRFISNAIDNIQAPRPSSAISLSHNNHPHNWVVSASDQSLQCPTFNLVDKKLWSPKNTIYNFNNCTVNFYNNNHENIKDNSPKKKKDVSFIRQILHRNE